MKTIQILGTDCATCRELSRDVENAAGSVGHPYHLERIDDPAALQRYGVEKPPALVIDGELKLAGRAPSVEELKDIIRES